MQVLAINSSPHMDEGGTGAVLTPFLDGMREAGASVELLHMSKLRVEQCRGCMSCWLRTPGRCAISDDMLTVLPRLAACDVLVLATPLYADGMSGGLKTLIERSIPLLDPRIIMREGRCRHPLREGVKGGALALVSACGFPELASFDPLMCHVEALAQNLGRTFAGALLRPHAAGLKKIERMGIEVASIYEAARSAGRQLVETGAVSPQTLAEVSRELMPVRVCVRAANAAIQSALDDLKGH